MTLGLITQRSALLRPSLTRHASSKSSKTSASQKRPHQRFSLPPEKLRSLVSLYHQSEHFITPNNLSKKIDQAFTIAFFSNNSSGVHFASYGELFVTANQKTGLPRSRDMNNGHVTYERVWSMNMQQREKEVFDAIYGVDNSKPGLDALLDEEEKIKRMLREGSQDESS